MDNTKSFLRHISLCSGYAGIDIGLRRVLPNCRTVAYVEIEAFAIQNLVDKIETKELDAAPIHTNLKTFPFKEFRGCVDILSGGFPCQPFSNAGTKQSTEDPRHLFPYILAGIEKCQPAVVFLENVEGIISSKTGDGESVLKYVLRSLEEVGYRATAGVFSASEIGAPHQRKRVFIMADRTNIGCSGDLRELADTSGTRTTTGLSKQKQWKKRHTEKSDNNSHRWPSRPNEPQYKWEEPRVFKVEPELGGAIDGSASRVDTNQNRTDRLRLLGNGVVPAVAENAFRVLSQKL